MTKLAYVFTEPQKLWIEALKSGEYQQTQNVLHDCQGFCCLGVACAVYEKATRHPLEKREGYIYGHDLDQQFAVKEWLGLYSARGMPKNTHLGWLTQLNDVQNYSFNQIAEHLEKYPEYYFNQGE